LVTYFLPLLLECSVEIISIITGFLLFRYLNRVARHPTLREDPDFRQFLEADVVMLHCFSCMLYGQFAHPNFTPYGLQQN